MRKVFYKIESEVGEVIQIKLFCYTTASVYSIM